MGKGNPNPTFKLLLVGPGKLAESDHIRRKKAASFRVSAMAVPSPHARLA